MLSNKSATCVAARVIGGAGTGKTAEALATMEKVIDAGQGIGPEQIGFCSFTRAARAEAAGRAASQWGINPDDLQKHGWFRTIHSVCYRCLEVRKGTLIADDKSSREWLTNALGEPVDYRQSDDQEFSELAFAEETTAATALKLWGVARNKLCTLREVYDVAVAVDDRLGDYESVQHLVAKYEQQKWLDDKVDFSDIVAQFAGIKFNVDGLPERIAPEGWVPDVPVWFLDEAQDISPLLGAAFERLTGHPGMKWLYLFGDLFQSIFSWSGADHRVFMNWPVAKQRIMPRSYRCPSNILALGESILSTCSDYFDRSIQPCAEGGLIEPTHVHDPLHLVDLIDPTEDWLVLARTNHQAHKLALWMNKRGIPCTHIRGRGTWKSESKIEALEALVQLEYGEAVSTHDWQRILKLLPSKQDGCELLVRGTKTRFAAEHLDQEWKRCDELTEFGATPELIGAISTGKWRAMVADAKEYCEASTRFGDEVVRNPRVRIGTIHSSKGMEADSVLLLTTTSRPVDVSQQTQDGYDAERRVEYVGVTRARHRLVLANERGAGRRMRLV